MDAANKCPDWLRVAPAAYSVPFDPTARVPHFKKGLGPVVGFSIGAVALKAGGGAPQVVAYVIAWALFAFQRLILWEIPFMPARFVWFRAAVSVPFPFLAAAIAMTIGRP